MWGKLGGADWNAALAKLGNAVAPPPGDQDQDDQYEEDDDDEDEEYEDDDEEEEDDDKGDQQSGFGLVGLLARALEPNQSPDQDEASESPTVDEDLAGPSSVDMDADATVGKTVPAVPPQLPVPVVGKVTTSQQVECTILQSTGTLDDWEDVPPESYRPLVGTTQEVPTEADSEPLQDIPITPVTTRTENFIVKQEASSKVESMTKPEKQRQNPSASMQTSTAVVSEPSPTLEVSTIEIRTKSTDGIIPQVPDFGTDNGVAQMSPGRERRFKAIERRAAHKTMEDNQDANNLRALSKLHNVPNSPSPDVSPVEESTLPVPGAHHVSTTSKKAPNVIPFSAPAVEAPKDHALPLPNTSAVVPSTTSQGDENNNYTSPNENVLLQQAETQILGLQRRLQQETERSNQRIEALMIQFQEKEARLLQASSEEYQHELAQAENRHQAALQALDMRWANEKKEFVKEQQKLQQLIEQSNSRAERAELELKSITKKHEAKLAQVTNQEQRSVRMMEEKLAQTMALLDDRDEQISKLKQTVKKMESSMNEHEEGAQEAEQEVEELQNENEALHDQVEHLEEECKNLKAKISILESQASEVGALQMEVTMLREEIDRERTKNQTMVQSTMTSHSQLESERDAALAQVRDLKQQLAATLADLEIARADQQRILLSNSNLQSALEAFQDERQAEMNLLDEQRLESEEAIKSAHAAALEALKQTHAAEIRQVQSVADKKLQQAMDETNTLKVSLNKAKSEHLQTRRALDEAIHRLQTTQEDVIDRTLMKNILIDWCTMKERDKRHQVLQLMASLLHFTEEEKESVHLTHLDIETVRSRVVGAIAAPLPPPKAKPEDLKGDNVSEKWINFLLAETDDDV